METAQETAIRVLELDPNWVQDKIWLDSHKIVEAMKAYAMQECEKVRRECADNAKEWVTVPLYKKKCTDAILSTPITLS